MKRLTLTQWNSIWYRGSCWQGMDLSDVQKYASVNPGTAVCEVVADGYPSMYGAAPSGWILDAVKE